MYDVPIRVDTWSTYRRHFGRHLVDTRNVDGRYLVDISLILLVVHNRYLLLIPRPSRTEIEAPSMLSLSEHEVTHIGNL